MRCANVLDVADPTDPRLARARELAAARRDAETTYRAAVAAERDEIARLLQAEEAGPVAIAAAIGRTREAVRLSYNQWKREQARADSGHDDDTA